MKIGTLTPTRNRKKFLDFTIDYTIGKQTVQPDFIEVVDDDPIYDDKDITWRYRIGFERLLAKGADLIIFIEDDDWYRSDYIEKTVLAWLALGRPEMIGINKTIYYNINVRGYRNMMHDVRASAMATSLSSKAVINWCKDTEPFLDLHLWTSARNYDLGRRLFSFDFNHPLCVGIKHNIGMVGGGGHKSNSKMYGIKDRNFLHLRKIIDNDTVSFNFYMSLIK